MGAGFRFCHSQARYPTRSSLLLTPPPNPMTTPPLPEQIEAHRDRMWRRHEDLRVESAIDAERFIEEQENRNRVRPAIFQQDSARSARQRKDFHPSRDARLGTPAWGRKPQDHEPKMI